MFVLDVIGESPKDRPYLEKLLGDGGKIIDMKVHPHLGDYGATHFKIEFDNKAEMSRFETLVKKLGFLV